MRITVDVLLLALCGGIFFTGFAAGAFFVVATSNSVKNTVLDWINSKAYQEMGGKQ